MSTCFDRAHPLAPVDPARLEGPEVGTLCRYRHDGSSLDGQTVRIEERSYVWAPEQHRPDGYHGNRRYDWSVVAYGEGFARTVVVNDEDLTPL